VTAIKVLDGLLRVDMDAFTTLSACCDPGLWPQESNQVISRG